MMNYAIHDGAIVTYAEAEILQVATSAVLTAMTYDRAEEIMHVYAYALPTKSGLRRPVIATNERGILWLYALGAEPVSLRAA